MLMRLGGRPAPEDSVGLLLECHARIREFVGMARRLGEVQGEVQGEGPEVVREAAGRVRRYFTEALPLHARDEEESILPRLQGRDPGLDAALATMAREHGEHEEPLARLVAACRALEADPSSLARVREALASSAAELETRFGEHLAGEESVIFPAMRRSLTPAEDGAVMAEIRGRRLGRGAAPAPAP